MVCVDAWWHVHGVKHERMQAAWMYMADIGGNGGNGARATV